MIASNNTNGGKKSRLVFMVARGTVFHSYLLVLNISILLLSLSMSTIEWLLTNTAGIPDNSYGISTSRMLLVVTSYCCCFTLKISIDERSPPLLLPIPPNINAFSSTSTAAWPYRGWFMSVMVSQLFFLISYCWRDYNIEVNSCNAG